MIFFCAVAWIYRQQPLLDMYFFRQTQTAITSYWMQRVGFLLAYETPVAGAPWSIPMEFPLYQWIVAVLSSLLNYSLDATGRLVSAAFLVGCLVPVHSIVKRLKLPSTTFWVFTALFLSSPAYVYWGRTYMIESAALFLSVSGVAFYLALRESATWKPIVLFTVVATAALLQKITTALPIFFLLGVFSLWHVLAKPGQLNSKIAPMLKVALPFVIPLAVGIVWTKYSDIVKLQNEFGIYITSDALSKWNWGALEQRITFPLYRDVLIKRMIWRDLGMGIGTIFVLLAILQRQNTAVRTVASASVLMAVTPLLFFPNLHIVHDYYQTANTAFLIFAASLGIAYFGQGLRWKYVALLATLVMIAGNLFMFRDYYLPITQQPFDKYHTRDLAVGAMLKREVPADQAFVAFGNDWNSSFAYYAERRSFTVPKWFTHLNDVIANPDKYVDGKLGAYLSCPDEKSPSIATILPWASSKGWRVGEVQGCTMALPADPKPVATLGAPVSCQGIIDTAEIFDDGTLTPKLRVSGWEIASRDTPRPSDRVFVVVQAPGKPDKWVEAIRYPRGDIETYYNSEPAGYGGFSALSDAQGLSAGDVTTVVKMNGRELQTCALTRPLQIKAKPAQ